MDNLNEKIRYKVNPNPVRRTFTDIQYEAGGIAGMFSYDSNSYFYKGASKYTHIRKHTIYKDIYFLIDINNTICHKDWLIPENQQLEFDFEV